MIGAASLQAGLRIRLTSAPERGELRRLWTAELHSPFFGGQGACWPDSSCSTLLKSFLDVFLQDSFRRASDRMLSRPNCSRDRWRQSVGLHRRETDRRVAAGAKGPSALQGGDGA
uniref:Uncharacterized protein n=1 Tax=Salvator merianae TaxID=96440 RepID=A0A8D0BPQ8_SALMN